MPFSWSVFVGRWLRRNKASDLVLQYLEGSTSSVRTYLKFLASVFSSILLVVPLSGYWFSCFWQSFYWKCKASAVYTCFQGNAHKPFQKNICAHNNFIHPSKDTHVKGRCHKYHKQSARTTLNSLFKHTATKRFDATLQLQLLSSQPRNWAIWALK